MRRNTTRIVTLVLAACLAVCFSGIGCEKKDDTPEPKDKSAGVTAPGGTAVLAALLAKADAKDGATDKVVTKCVTCALAMDGSADHKVSVEGYEVHLCSADCKKSFEGDPTKSLQTLKLE